jgi:hypothetical protein
MDSEGVSQHFVLQVFEEGDHWTSTLSRLGDDGLPEVSSVAPRFYGVTSEQARRRMIAVLENQFEEVRSENGQ